jgi:beta-phosphoglucomutase-like phosphatase (HAD superfamily)
VSDAGVILRFLPARLRRDSVDLDGVLTRTASVHAAAWKKLFDAFLEHRAAETGEPFVPFDIDAASATAVPVRERRGLPYARRRLACAVPADTVRNRTPQRAESPVASRGHP